MSLTKTQAILLALCLFAHVLILNLFYVTPKGLVFYWEENFNIKALLVYLCIALISTGFYLLLTRGRIAHYEGRLKVGEKVWSVFSVLLLIIIGYLLW
ncbi:hypothetical protein AADZ91_00105 [Colwelliaceae bacterium 6441]